MGSYSKGKEEAVCWIKEHFNKGIKCLDVGACNGKWFDLLWDYMVLDGVEVWQPYINKYNLVAKYRRLFEVDIREFEYEWYDLIIFGDIIEHLSVEEAQKVIEYARPRCQNMIVAVPFKYKQGEKNGNPYEVHIQDDLTPELFNERYQGFVPIYMSDDYAYYVKNKDGTK